MRNFHFPHKIYSCISCEASNLIYATKRKRNSIPPQHTYTRMKFKSYTSNKLWLDSLKLKTRFAVKLDLYTAVNVTKKFMGWFIICVIVASFNTCTLFFFLRVFHSFLLSVAIYFFPWILDVHVSEPMTIKWIQRQNCVSLFFLISFICLFNISSNEKWQIISRLLHTHIHTLAYVNLSLLREHLFKLNAHNKWNVLYLGAHAICIIILSRTHICANMNHE